MKRKPATLLVFLALLAFVAQVWAAPFLMECRLFRQASMPMDDCHAMDMAAQGGRGGMDHHAAQDAPDDTMAGSSTGGCEQLCFHCPGNSAARQAKVILPAPTLELPASDSSIPDPRLKGLFRPPIFA